MLVVSSSAEAGEAAVVQLVAYSDGGCVAAPGLRHDEISLAVTWVVVIVGIGVTDRFTGAATVASGGSVRRARPR
ncbi:hypothetical protein Ae706Ps2_6437c [Pseudonocardia sp. Ae706_Ps2]|nr:hypothetical protein Ae706Ps2_6437c [Pseudonocardia sp. Ae706_Ps2]